MRYQITRVTPRYNDKNNAGKTTDKEEDAVTDNGKTIEEGGTPIIVSYDVSADYKKGWNWSLKPYSTSYDPFIYANGVQSNVNGYITSNFVTSDLSFEIFKSYYDGNLEGGAETPLVTENFSSAFIGNNSSNPVIKSDYNRALEYAIYNIVLGITPRNMKVTYTGENGAPVVTIDGYSATTGANAKTSAEVAVEDIKSTFNRLGSYVGLTTKNKKDIVKYILENVIGTQAKSEYTVKGIEKQVNYYYEDVVTAIVDYCGKLTTIGKASSDEAKDDTKIDDAYIASEVADYPYTTFFSKFGNGDPFKNKKPYEYQSAVIVPSRETTVTDIWLDFKYDAGNDGDDIYDPEKFLDITVSIRWNKGDGSPIHVMQKNVRIKDGPVDVGGESTIEFEFEPARGSYAFGEPVKIGMFNTPDALKTTKEQRVITISGLTDARRYYKVLQSATYGGYGVLDNSKFDCSYLEIAYSVAKIPGDTTTNYAFYTSISNFVEDEEEDTSWMH